MEQRDNIDEMEVSPFELEELVEEPEDITLLDIREPAEREIVSIDDDIWIPMGEIPESVEKLNELPEPIVVYCHHGMRSLKITHFLREKNFEEVFSLAGGIDAWSKKINPELPTY